MTQTIQSRTRGAVIDLNMDNRRNIFAIRCKHESLHSSRKRTNCCAKRAMTKYSRYIRSRSNGN
jgi:hypothetical protein